MSSRVTFFFLQKITSRAGLVGSGLKSIFDLKAHFEINERSWVRSFVLYFYSSKTLKTDVSSANTFTLLFKPSGMTLIYIGKRRVPNMEP